MQKVLKVVAQSATVPITRQDGTQTQKCTIVLQEIGSRYENSYAATMLGNTASCKFYPNDIVYANLRFSHREYNGQYYLEATVQDIVKFNTGNAF